MAFEWDDSNLNQDVDLYLVKSENKIKDVINKLKSIKSLGRHQVAELKRLLNEENIVGFILYLRLEIEVEEEQVNQILSMLGESPDLYALVLSTDAGFEEMLNFVQNQLGATDEELIALREIEFLSIPDRIADKPVELLKEYISVFRKYSSLRKFPAKLHRMLMENAFAIEEYIQAMEPDKSLVMTVETTEERYLANGRVTREKVIKRIGKGDFKDLKNGDILNVGLQRYLVRNGELIPLSAKSKLDPEA